MDDSDIAGKSDVVYSSGEDGATSVLSERVSSLAAAIYAEFERMIQKHGQEVVSGLMSLCSNSLTRPITTTTNSTLIWNCSMMTMNSY